jgi:hypothetical protein
MRIPTSSSHALVGGLRVANPPYGLSFVTKVAPARILSMMMGVWLATSFTGGFLAGFLGSFWSRMVHIEFFLMIAAIAACAGAMILACHRPLKGAPGSERHCERSEAIQKGVAAGKGLCLATDRSLLLPNLRGLRCINISTFIPYIHTIARSTQRLRFNEDPRSKEAPGPSKPNRSRAVCPIQEL